MYCLYNSVQGFSILFLSSPITISEINSRLFLDGRSDFNSNTTITSSNASPAHGQINDSAERNGHALSHPSAINGHPPARMRFSAYVTILGN